MMKRLSLAIVLCCMSSSVATSQCSDAGACSISHKLPSALPHQVGISYTFGTSGKPDDLSFHTARLSGEFTLSEASRLSLELPYSAQYGPLGKASGIGDAIIIWNQQLYRQVLSGITVHIGAKLAVGHLNSGNFPQAYQSSLGTNDILLGVTYHYSKWNASLVYQISSGRSKNNLTRLKRGDDLLARSGYGFSAGETNVLLELLAIKRLERSSVVNTATPTPDDYIEIPDSDQFQINLQGTATHPLNERYNIQLRMALPLLNRDVNVDGLKRSLTVGIGISHLF